MSDKIEKVLIVGGGTAGWLTATVLAKKFSALKRTIEVTLIESSEIPTIGVGEGTFPTMLDTLRYLGVSEATFITECDATFKQGIRFSDWLTNPNNGNSHSYYHLFNPPSVSQQIDLVANWLNCNSVKPEYAHAVSAQAFICDANLSPKRLNTAEYQFQTKYAYHFDAGKLVSLLKKIGKENLGVKHIIATVEQAEQNANGDISCIVTHDKQTIDADFFVDCSGFSSLLIGKTLNSPFVDLNEILFVDHAIAIQVPYADATQPIASYTIASAQEAGWTWDIGLSQRRGVGYVYSSKHTSHERAEQVLRDYVSKTSDDDTKAQELPIRTIPMRVGYRQYAWINNCVGIGFSGGFVEPLEATAISMIEASVFMLAGQFPQRKADMSVVAKKYNEAFIIRWEKIVDFIKLHYCLSRRSDHQFWLDHRANQSMPQSLLDKLALWKVFPPQENDFSSRFEMFTLASYQYVLFGMEFASAKTYVNGSYENQVAEKIFDAIAMQGAKAKNDLPNHREMIDSIYSRLK